MATSKARKAPAKQKAAKSAGTGKTPKKAKPQALGLLGAGSRPNRLLMEPDGRLVVQSGHTGEITDVDPALREQIEALLHQRQQAGIALTELLQGHGFDVAPAIPMFFDE
jgi:hypothetical protein